MKNVIQWTRKAVKQLAKIHTSDKTTVYDCGAVVGRYAHVPQVKALTGHGYSYRLRVGRYRVLFDWDGAIKIVHIGEVKKRDERTYLSAGHTAHGWHACICRYPVGGLPQAFPA